MSNIKTSITSWRGIALLSCIFQLKFSIAGDNCSTVVHCSQTQTSKNSGCTCAHGFEIDDDGKSYKVKDPTLKIVFVNMFEVDYVDVTHKVSQVARIVSNRSYGRSLTCDARNSLVYWLDNMEDQFIAFRTNIQGQGAPKPMLNLGSISPRAMAFDWITGNLYYVESSSTGIFVCGNTSSVGCAMVLASKTISKELHLIEVHPNQGYVFWLGPSQGRDEIYRAGMDGSDGTLIVAMQDVIYSMAVDQGSNRIYWSIHWHIWSSDFNGKCKKMWKVLTLLVATHDKL